MLFYCVTTYIWERKHHHLDDTVTVDYFWVTAALAACLLNSSFQSLYGGILSPCNIYGERKHHHYGDAVTVDYFWDIAALAACLLNSSFQSLHGGILSGCNVYMGEKASSLW